MNNLRFKSFLLLLLSFIIFVSFGINSVDAATRTWTGTASNLWDVDANWGGTKPVAGDDLVFPSSASNKSTSNDFSADTTFNSITFEGSSYTLAGNRITLPAGGIASDSAFSANTISLDLTLSATTTIDIGTGQTLTISSVISGIYGVNKTGGGTLKLYGDNSFSGGLIIKAGTLSPLTSANALGGNGTGLVTLGNSAGGSDDVTLWVSTSLTFANPIVLADNTTGTLAISNNSSYPVITGGVTGNNDLTFINNGGTNLTLSGGAINNIGTITNAGTGSGSVSISSVIGTNVTEVIQNSSSSDLSLSGNNTFTSGVTVLKGEIIGGTSENAFGAGNITLGNSAGGSDDAGVYIGGVSLTFANPIVLADNTTGTLAVGSTGCSSPVTFSGGVTGNNDFTIIGTSCGYRTLSFTTGSLNNVGTITNATVRLTDHITISSVIGSNVTEFINNNDGDITLSGNNTFDGLTILKGTVSGITSNNAFGAGDIILGNSVGGSDDATLKGSTDGLTFPNPIILASNTTGTLKITNNSCDSLTFSGGVTGTNDLYILGSGCSRTIYFTTGSINNTGTITMSSSVASRVEISSVIGPNVTDIFSDMTGIAYLNGNSPNFSGNVKILKGLLSGSNNDSFGTGTITIGNSAGGSDDAELRGSGDLVTYPNPIVLADNTTGILTISNQYTGSCGSPTFSGGITGNNDVSLVSACSRTLTFSNGSINNAGSVSFISSNTGFGVINSTLGSNVDGLIINGSGSSKLTLSGDNSTVSGDVTITDGILQISGTTNLNVSGGWSNSDTFTANQSTVTFTSGSHTTSGANTFYNLTLNPNNTVTFPAGVTQTFDNNFSCSGTPGNTITINSDNPGTEATLSKSSGTVNCDYLLLSDSDATGGATWNAGDNSIKYDNVTGWLGGLMDGGSGGSAIVNIVRILIKGGTFFKGGSTF